MDELAGSFTPPLTIEVARADIDEKALRRDSPRELVLALAHAKADALLPRLAGAAADAAGGAYLITCDQVVLHDNVIREKPANADEARRFIRSYATSPAQTVGAVIATNLLTGVRAEALEICTIHMQPLPDDAVEALLQEGEIMYCAGGLMVEHALVAPHVTRIDGPGVDAVMGLGKDAVMRVLLDAAGC